MRTRSRVLSIVLCDRERLFTDSGTFRSRELEVPELTELLSSAESLSLEWLLDGVATNEVDWNIDAYTSWDRAHENTPVSFFAAVQTTAGPGLANPSNFTSASWTRHCRLQLKWALHTGVTVPKEALLSAVLYVTTSPPRRWPPGATSTWTRSVASPSAAPPTRC